jgi:hypothetical protein
MSGLARARVETEPPATTRGAICAVDPRGFRKPERFGSAGLPQACGPLLEVLQAENAARIPPTASPPKRRLLSRSGGTTTPASSAWRLTHDKRTSSKTAADRRTPWMQATKPGVRRGERLDCAPLCAGPLWERALARLPNARARSRKSGSGTSPAGWPETAVCCTFCANPWSGAPGASFRRSLAATSPTAPRRAQLRACALRKGDMAAAGDPMVGTLAPRGVFLTVALEGVKPDRLRQRAWISRSS